MQESFFYHQAWEERLELIGAPIVLVNLGLKDLRITLSEELEKTNIRVNTINPGKMSTEMRRIAYPAEDSSKIPSPESKSPAIVYLMLPENSKIHGQQLTVAE